MRRCHARKWMILSLSGARHGFLKFSLSSLSTSETASLTNPSTLMRPLPMELLSRLQFSRVRHLRRRRTYCCLTSLHFHWVLRCKAMYSGLLFHGTHLSRQTSLAFSLRSRITKRLLHSLCMFFPRLFIWPAILRLMTVTKESGLSVVTTDYLASSSLLASL